MIVIENMQQFETEVLNSNKPTLVDFFATWCGPCRSQAPILDTLASTYPNVKVVKVDTDLAPDVAGAFGIMSIPTLIAFENGTVKNKAVGLQSLDNLKKLLGI